jgi:trans-aconitate 2-methyltransferase
MPTWNATQYLKFGDERTRPSRDLAGRIEVAQPARVIDLGCGPGNSTEVLAERWPDAEITGLDNSARMIESARTAHQASHPTRSTPLRWVAADIAAWATAEAGETFDVVFSNAALHWLPDHASLLPRLMRRVAPGGALAFQMPAHDAPAHHLMRGIARTMAAAFAWRVDDWHSHEPPFYYDVLAACARRVDLWQTEYVHVMADAEAIVEWYRGTGLRPFLDALGTDAERERFTGEFLEGLRDAYPKRADGRVLFPFRRVFAIAYASRSEPRA